MPSVHDHGACLRSTRACCMAGISCSHNAVFTTVLAAGPFLPAFLAVSGSGIAHRAGYVLSFLASLSCLYSLAVGGAASARLTRLIQSRAPIIVIRVLGCRLGRANTPAETESDHSRCPLLLDTEPWRCVLAGQAAWSRRQERIRKSSYSLI